MFTIIIKTIELKDSKIVLKENNRCYINKNKNIEKPLLIYDPKQNDKLLNIVNIYDRCCNYSFILLSNNRIFIGSINSVNFKYYIFELLLNLEINDTIENIICTTIFDFIIIKNLNIFKIVKCNNHLQKPILIKSLNYNIIDIIKLNNYHEFIYIANNEKQSIKISDLKIQNVLNS